MNTPGDDVLALEGAPPGSEPEAQVLEALGEEELTQHILALREPYKTPCRLMLLEQHTAAEAAAGPRKQWRRRSSGQKRCWPRS